MLKKQRYLIYPTYSLLQWTAILLKCYLVIYVKNGTIICASVLKYWKKWTSVAFKWDVFIDYFYDHYVCYLVAPSVGKIGINDLLYWN